MRIVSKVFVKMLNRPPATGLAPTFVEQSTLPKLIHQTFPGRTLAPEVQANIDALRSLNPDWQHTLYDDAEIARFIRQAYGERVYERFDRIDPTYGAAKADLFRYLLLYKLGGFYLDIKSSMSRPLDSVLRPDERYWIGQWPSGPEAEFQGAGLHPETEHIHGGEFQQWFVLATPGHPFLKAVIENVLRNIAVYNPALHGVGKPGVLRVTGPIAYTLAIAPLVEKHAHRRVDAGRDLGLCYSIYPMVDKADNKHVSLFKNHYSQSRESLVKLRGLTAVATKGLLAVEDVILKARQAVG